jgi:hypothetical protein
MKYQKPTVALIGRGLSGIKNNDPEFKGSGSLEIPSPHEPSTEPAAYQADE